MSLQSVRLTCTDHIIHLGHHLSATLLDSADIEHRRADFCSQANYFLSRFSHVIPVIKCKVFKTIGTHFTVDSYGTFSVDV